MLLTDKNYIRSVLKAYGSAPKESLGQNFLTDRRILDVIIKTAHLEKEGIAVEVGPGLGVLTEELLKAAGRVITIEKDDRLAADLFARLGAPDNLEIVHDDVLRVNLAELVTPGEYKVVANIPYYLTSPLIRYFLETAPTPNLIVLLVQKEVAQRLVAEPGQLSLLGISAQFYAEVELIKEVSKTSFWPEPKVDSAIVRITPRSTPAYSDEKAFFRLVRAGFSAKRKTLLNTLSSGLHIEKAEAQRLLEKTGINAAARAQELSLDQWAALTESFKELQGG